MRFWAFWSGDPQGERKMKIRLGLREFLWMVVGAIIFVIFALILTYALPGRGPAQAAMKAKRLELVSSMEAALAQASDAQNSAVMAMSDEDSRKFADQAGAAVSEVDQQRDQLGKLLTGAGLENERDLLAQFNEAFAEFKRVEKDLLSLAVLNSNKKAYGLAYGPAAEALTQMDSALARLSTDDVQVVRAAANARLAAWRSDALHPAAHRRRERPEDG